jgi:hypothetical protein
MKAFAIGIAGIAATKSGKRVIDENAVGDKHDAEKGEKAEQYMPAC